MNLWGGRSSVTERRAVRRTSRSLKDFVVFGRKEIRYTEPRRHNIHEKRPPTDNSLLRIGEHLASSLSDSDCRRRV